MTPLTPGQRALILSSFLAMDPYATHSTPAPDTWNAFSYHGRITLDGLVDLAFLITCLLYGPHLRPQDAPETDLP